MPESSTYKSNLFLTTADMSLTYTKYKRDPNISPWGMPQVMGEHDGCVPDKYINCVLSKRYDLNKKKNIIA